MGVRELCGDILNTKSILLVVLTPIVLLPLLLSGGSPVAKCAYCVIMMAVFWVSEALPISVTALLPVFLFPMVGLLSLHDTSMQYINGTSMLFIGGLIVAAAIETWNIHKRIALRILMLVGANPRWVMLGLMIPTWFLSMWISNTATTSMMVPITNAILMQLKDTDKHFKKSRAVGKDNHAMELDEIVVTEKKEPISNGPTIEPSNEPLPVNDKSEPLPEKETHFYDTVETGPNVNPNTEETGPNVNPNTETHSEPNAENGVKKASFKKSSIKKGSEKRKSVEKKGSKKKKSSLKKKNSQEVTKPPEPDIYIMHDDEVIEKVVDFDNIPDNVLGENEDPSFVRLCKALTLSIGYAANVGGIGSLTGTGPNLVFKGQLDIIYDAYKISDSPITFSSWLAFGIPVSLLLVFFVWGWLQILYLSRGGGLCQGSDKEKDEKVRSVIRREYDSLGPISFAQAAVMGHFLLLAILWITRDMGGAFGWGVLFEKGYVRAGVPAIFVACSLFIFPSTLPQVLCRRPEDPDDRVPLKPLLSWKQAVEKVPWGVVFLLGGGFAMADAAQSSGLSAMIGDKLTVLDDMSPWLRNLMLCYVTSAMTEITSNTATCTLMMPILANLAVNLKQNPVYLMFPVAIASSFAFMLPVGTPPNAVVFSYGYLRVIDMIISGFVLNIGCVLVLAGLNESLGRILFKYDEIPAEILAIYYANSTAT